MLEFNSICRLCLNDGEPKLPIFMDYIHSKNGLSLPARIMSLAKVQVAENDGLPPQICVKCYCKVHEAVEFIHMCEASYQVLIQQLRSPQPSAILPLSLEGFNSAGGEDPVSQAQRGEEELRWTITSTSGNTGHWMDAADKSGEEKTVEVDMTIVKAEWDVGDTCKEEEIVQSVVTGQSGGGRSAHPPFDTPDMANGSLGYLDEMVNINFKEMSKKDGSKFYQCLKCRQYIATRVKCRSHVIAVMKRISQDPKEMHISNGPFSCDICSRVFPTRQQITIHKMFHRKCKWCGENRTPREKHICDGRKTVPTFRNFCKLCQIIVKHMHVHVKTKGHKAKLQGSKQNADGEREKPVQCNVCGLSVASYRGLFVHWRRSHPELIYNCKLCTDVSFPDYAQCRSHLVSVHGKPDWKLIRLGSKPLQSTPRKRKANFFSCEYCKKNCDSFNDCLRHLSVAHKVMNAEKVVVTYGTVDEAVNVGEKPAEPPKGGLTGRATHPPFLHASPIVENNFEKVNGSRGNKLYKCKWCHQTFKYAYQHYYYHKSQGRKPHKVVHKLRPVRCNVCKVCKRRFASRVQLLCHKNSAHKKPAVRRLSQVAKDVPVEDPSVKRPREATKETPVEVPAVKRPRGVTNEVPAVKWPREATMETPVEVPAVKRPREVTKEVPAVKRPREATMEEPAVKRPREVVKEHCDVCREDVTDMKTHIKSKSHHLANVRLGSQQASPEPTVVPQTRKSDPSVKFVKIIFCKTCHKTFRSDGDLKTHQLNHDNETDSEGTAVEENPLYQCQLCGKTFQSEYHLAQHDHLSHHNPPLNCRFCPRIFLLEAARLNHETAKHYELQLKTRKYKFQHTAPLATETCGILLPGLSAHYMCSLCRQVVMGAELFKKHVASHHPTHGVYFKCRGCPQVFLRPTLPLLHDTVCTLISGSSESMFALVVLPRAEMELNYECNKCFARVASYMELEAHLKTHNNPTMVVIDDSDDVSSGAVPPEYHCSICQMAFGTENEIIDHLSTQLHKDLRTSRMNENKRKPIGEEKQTNASVL